MGNEISEEQGNNKNIMQYRTEHLPLFRNLDAVAKLYSQDYLLSKKALYYQMHSIALKKNPKSFLVTLGGIEDDVRIHLVFVMPSGRGKLNIKTALNKIFEDWPGLHIEEPALSHDQQLLGKNVLVGGKVIELKGYLHRDVVFLEESYNILAGRDGFHRAIRSNINKALDPYGKSKIQKKLVDQDFEEGLKYFSDTIFTIFLQPRFLSKDCLEDGFLRRVLIAYNPKLEQLDTDSFKEIFAERIEGPRGDSDALLMELRDYLAHCATLSEPFSFTPEAKSLLKELPKYFLEQAVESGQNEIAVSFATTLQNTLVLIACILASAHNRSEVSGEFVKFAFLDLTEFFASALAYTKLKVWALPAGRFPPETEATLSFLGEKEAFSFDSAIPINELYSFVARNKGVSVDMAKKDVKKLKESRLLKAQRDGFGKGSEIKVWLLHRDNTDNINKGSSKYFEILADYEKLIEKISWGY